MHSALFEQANLEVQADQRFALQNPQMLRVHLGGDVLAVKGAMVAYQGAIRFDHEKSGTMGKLFKKVVTGEDVSLMRVSGTATCSSRRSPGSSSSSTSPATRCRSTPATCWPSTPPIDWDIKRVQGAGMLSGGLFNTTLQGTGTVAIHTVGQPVILDCSQQPTYVDVEACVGWSANLVPQVVSSMNVRSMLRGGSGEAFQYAFHGPGFVVVQPSEWAASPAQAPGRRRASTSADCSTGEHRAHRPAAGRRCPGRAGSAPTWRRPATPSAGSPHCSARWPAPRSAVSRPSPPRG